MEILKTATDWARAEVFSSSFFILFGIMFMVASIGFWYLGKTEISKSYITPMLVAGSLLLIIGGGLFFANKMRITNFETAYNNDAQAFVISELDRAERTMGEYRTIVFKVIPLIIIVCTLLIIFFDKPVWRASSITTIAMMVVILLVDGTAKDRIEVYKKQLISVEKQDLK